MVNKFWMVLGAGQPTFHHPDVTSATTEAERLARLHPGATFTVLESVAQVRTNDLQWQRHEPASAEIVNADVPL